MTCPIAKRGTFSVPLFFISLFLPCIVSLTAENFSFPAFASDWQTFVWSNDVSVMERLERTCLECGILSGDVLWANGYEGGTLPSDGENLLIPSSRSAIVPTWLEVQNRKKGGSEPLVSIPLHGLPALLRSDRKSDDSPTLSPSESLLSTKTTDPNTPLPSAPPSSPDLPAQKIPASGDIIPAGEPLVMVKLHGRPAFLQAGASGDAGMSLSSPDRKNSPVSEDRPTPPALSEKKSATVSPPADSAVSDDRTAFAATPNGEPIKNMKLVVSGDELVILTSSGLRIMKGDIASPDPVSLPSLVLTPPGQKPLRPEKPTFVAPGKMLWPVSGKVSSGYGKRGKQHFHTGLDMPMPRGTPIQAAMDGVVLETCSAQSKKYRGYGNAVLIDHGSGIVTMYAHCQKVTVKAGQKIRQGEIVGLVGNTGRTTTWHVHFEVRKNGRPVDPMPWMAKRS